MRWGDGDKPQSLRQYGCSCTETRPSSPASVAGKVSGAAECGKNRLPALAPPQECPHADLGRRELVLRRAWSRCGRGAGDKGGERCRWHGDRIGINHLRGSADFNGKSRDGGGVCGARGSSDRASNHRLSAVFCALMVQFSSGHGVTRCLVLVRVVEPASSALFSSFYDLKPASALAFHPIDPVLAIGGRLAGPRQALCFRGSGRRGCGGTGIEEFGKRRRKRG